MRCNKPGAYRANRHAIPGLPGPDQQRLVAFDGAQGVGGQVVGGGECGAALAHPVEIASDEPADRTLVQDGRLDGAVGQMASTPTPRPAASERSARDNPTTACLVIT